MINLGLVLTAEQRARLAPALMAIPATATPFERWHLVSLACLQQGFRELAMESILRAISIDPEQDSPWKNLSYVSFHAGEHETSLRAIQKARHLDPLAADTRIRSGLCLLRMGEPASSTLEFRAGLCLDPVFRGGNLNLGVALDEQKLGRQAMDAYFREISAYPASAEAYFNLGNAAFGLGLSQDSVGYYDTAIELGLRTPDVTMSSALAHLSIGNFELGWLRFEDRFGLAEHRYARPQLASKKPMIGSSEPPYGRVLVWAEQGLGDEIMFGSLLGEFAPRADRLLVQLDRRLLPIFRRSFGSEVEFVERGQPPDESLYDMHTPIGSLGRILRPSLKSFSTHNGCFLRPDVERAQAMRSTLIGDSEAFLIGISWMTTSADTRSARSVPLTDLVSVLSRSGVELVSLQYGDVTADLEALRKSGLGDVQCLRGLDTNDDIDGVTALVQACDLVVTIGNTVAHIAGSIGKRAFVLLPQQGIRASANRVMPGWRWLEADGASVWYRSIRLFRCQQDTDWSPVLDGVSSALEALLRGSE